MEDEAQEETFMSDYEQGKLLKGISNCTQPDVTLFYFIFTYLWGIDLFEVLEIMAQMWQYIFF